MHRAFNSKDLYGLGRATQSHAEDNSFWGKITRLILEIMHILDAFSNKVGGEKNGDGAPQLETKPCRQGKKDTGHGTYECIMIASKLKASL